MTNGTHPHPTTNTDHKALKRKAPSNLIFCRPCNPSQPMKWKVQHSEVGFLFSSLGEKEAYFSASIYAKDSQMDNQDYAVLYNSRLSIIPCPREI
jgi:hypothetical protein